MRDFIDIVSENDLPKWFVRGKVVDINDHPDAPYILEDGEWDLEWRLCMLPAKDLLDIVGHSEADFQNKLKRIGSDADRLNSIGEWMKDHPSGKLSSSTPLLIDVSGELKLLDGFHRIGTAIYKFGLSNIPATVAVIR